MVSCRFYGLSFAKPDEFTDSADSDSWSILERNADASKKLADEKKIEENDAVARAGTAQEGSGPRNDSSEPDLEVEDAPLEFSKHTEADEWALSGVASKKKAKKIKSLSAAFGEYN